MFNLQDLIDDAKCYAEIRKLRWTDGVRCPESGSSQVTKRGIHDHQPYRQGYRCQTCAKQFDDLTDTIFEGHHQPLKVKGAMPVLYGAEPLQSADCSRTGAQQG
jgi:transposase-like protein